MAKSRTAAALRARAEQLTTQAQILEAKAAAKREQAEVYREAAARIAAADGEAD